MLEWRDMVPYLLAGAPGIPTAVAVAILSDAAAHYCKETAAWCRELAPIDTEEGEFIYPLSSPAGTAVSLVLECSGTSDFIFLPPDQVQFVGCLPDEPFVLKVALMPASDSPGLPAWFWSCHKDGIVHEALARIYRLPGQPWSDLNAALYHDGEAQLKIGKAKIAQASGNQAASLHVRPRGFL